MRHGWSVEMLMMLAVVIWVAPALSSATGEREGMPRIGPAPELSLTTQAGQRLSLTGLDANQVVMLGAAALSYAIHEYLIHYHTARNHQGLDNQLIVREGAGGLLSYYHREAA